jgi:hypothetical protein
MGRGGRGVMLIDLSLHVIFVIVMVVIYLRS